MNNNIIEGLNNAFSELSQNYKELSNGLALKKKEIKNDELLITELMILEISINELVNQLQNINIKIDALPASGINSELNIKPLDNDTSKLINKTMKEMMPLFLCALMNNDKNSILNSNPFMKSAIDTMAKLSNMMPQSHQQSKSQVPTPLEYDSAHNVDDVD